MYDFIKPKMETYFFPPFGDQKFEFFPLSTFRYSSVSCSSSLFLFASLSYRRESAQKKKHQKCTRNSNDLKCFAGQVWGASGDMKQWLENLLMKYFFSFSFALGLMEQDKTRKTSIGNFSRDDFSSTDGERRRRRWRERRQT